MNLLIEFSQKYKLLSTFLVIMFVGLVMGMWLEIKQPPFWFKFINDLIGQNNQVVLNANEEKFFIRGKVTDISDKIIKIVSDDSYFTFNVNDQTAFMDWGEAKQELGLKNIKIGINITVRINESKYQTWEPFNARYIIIND